MLNEWNRIEIETNFMLLKGKIKRGNLYEIYGVFN